MIEPTLPISHQLNQLVRDETIKQLQAKFGIELSQEEIDYCWGVCFLGNDAAL